ncbi:FeoB-associated Cys-rich membrane protein [Haloimpatiens sp. FM7330]|uniref:FeoB-associated Cys-rich membrane protein n=1 Tax=Haloimpatiens sp. FM7330 TaxID=3298610 RepID=UPI00362F2A15
MFVEILITVIIISAASYFLYKNIKSKASGKCNCSNCSSHCTYYGKKKEEEKQKDN